MHMYLKLLSFFIGILIPVFSLAQVQKLLDPNGDSNTLSSELSTLTAFKGDLYGYANAEDKEGLFKLNQVSDEMELIYPNLKISSIVATDSMLIMIGQIPGLEGNRIWRSDGTLEGTSKIESSPTGFYYFQDLKAHGNYAYVPIVPSGSPSELWATDGSESGTNALAGIRISGNFGYSRKLAFTSSKAFFIGNKNQTEVAIYETDGTANGTIERHSDLNWDRFSENPWNLVGVDSLVYFIQDELNEKQLWQIRKDTTAYLSSIPPSISRQFGYMYQIHAYDGAHYFHGGKFKTQLDSLYLLRTNGSLGDLDTAYTFSHRGNPLAFFSVSHGLISIVQGEFGRPELSFYSSGAMSDSIVSMPQFQTPGQIGVSIDSIAIFSLNSFTVMRSDGSPSGTYTLADFSWSQGYTRIIDADTIGNDLYLAGEAFEVGKELFRLRNGNLEFVDDVEETPQKAHIRSLNLLPSAMVFSAFSDSTSQELWYSDGTSAGSGLLKDIYFETNSPPTFVNGSFPDAFTFGEDLLYFSARDTNGSYFIPHVTDGSNIGTRRIADLWTGGPQSSGFNLSNHYFWQGKLYFGGAEPLGGALPINAELYQYDPDIDSSILLKEIEPLPFNISGYGSFPQNFEATDSLLFFLAETFDFGQELWSTDGTASGTQLVKDIEPGTIGGYTNPQRGFPFSLVGLDSILIFTAHNRSSGWQLWRSNGSESGTYTLQDSITSRSIGRLSQVSDRAIFWENRPGQGLILWGTDGTDVGTVVLLDSLPFARNIFPEILYSDSQIAFFTFYSDSLGLELWKTDGTISGTELVKDFVRGTGSSSPSDVTFIGGDQYLFWADDSTGERLLWTTNGTEGGTYMLEDYKLAGQGLFRENQLLLGNGFVYFVAEDKQSGESLFRYDLQGLGIFNKSNPKQFLVYPNPAQDILWLNPLDRLTKPIKQLTIYDLQGRKLREYSISSTLSEKVEVRLPKSLIPGYYLLKIDIGDQFQFVKFLKRK